MAKAKKSTGTEPSPAKKKETKGKPAVAGAAPLVDTNLAAQSAAKRLAAGFSSGIAGGAPVAPSAAFKHMKEAVNKPHIAGLDSILDKTAPSGPGKTNQPSHSFNKQTGRNQTFGADVNRTGVPRRTGGG
jgi:hypothetical protein